MGRQRRLAIVLLLEGVLLSDRDILDGEFGDVGRHGFSDRAASQCGEFYCVVSFLGEHPLSLCSGQHVACLLRSCHMLYVLLYSLLNSFINKMVRKFCTEKRLI